MAIPRAERLRITQQVYSKWSEIYDDRDDAEAEEAYAKMHKKPLPKLKRNI